MAPSCGTWEAGRISMGSWKGRRCPCAVIQTDPPTSWSVSLGFRHLIHLVLSFWFPNIINIRRKIYVCVCIYVYICKKDLLGHCQCFWQCLGALEERFLNHASMDRDVSIGVSLRGYRKGREQKAETSDGGIKDVYVLMFMILLPLLCSSCSPTVKEEAVPSK